MVSMIIASSAAYITLNPAPTEQFFAMWVLGSNGLAADYYPNNNPNLTINESVNWTIGVNNHMSPLAYVVVRVKLLNSTTPGPDSSTGIPSPAATLIEFRRVLVDNETWSIPFVWEVSNVTTSGNYVKITTLVINGMPFSGNMARAESGLNYRLVFELWFFDPNTGQLSFSWTTQATMHVVWDQIWFNATYS